MQTLSGDSVSLTVLFLYGLIILLYLIILRLLLNMLQQLNDKHHRTQKSIIDVDVHRIMTPQVESSMHAFDISTLAITIAKGGIAAIAMAAIIVLLVLKIGFFATLIIIAIVILIAWALDLWLRSREKPGGIRSEVQKYVQKSGSVGTILLLSILLVILLFIMTWLH